MHYNGNPFSLKTTGGNLGQMCLISHPCCDVSSCEITPKRFTATGHLPNGQSLSMSLCSVVLCYIHGCEQDQSFYKRVSCPLYHDQILFCVCLCERTIKLLYPSLCVKLNSIRLLNTSY